MWRCFWEGEQGEVAAGSKSQGDARERSKAGAEEGQEGGAGQQGVSGVSASSWLQDEFAPLLVAMQTLGGGVEGGTGREEEANMLAART